MTANLKLTPIYLQHIRQTPFLAVEVLQFCNILKLLAGWPLQFYKGIAFAMLLPNSQLPTIHRMKIWSDRDHPVFSCYRNFPNPLIKVLLAYTRNLFYL
jgi:hypothetical protein